MCTKEKIILYDKDWKQLEPSIAKDGFKQMKSITYDPANDIFYFTDRKHPQTSIFSLKVNGDTTFLTTPLVPRSENEVIEDLVYDAHGKALYWSDSGNKKIVKLEFDRSKNLKWRNETFLEIAGEVSGLELDSCQRNLYYSIVTEANPSINFVSLDMKGDKPVSFGNENHYKPIAIAMDHQERRLYVADVRKYNSYSIDSISSDGTDFRTEIAKAYKTPRSVAVDNDYVYYVEGNGHELRRFKKGTEKKTSERFFDLPFDPTDIIVRSNFITDLKEENCKVPKHMIDLLKKEMADKETKKETPNKICLHGGSLDNTTFSCMCKENYDGDFCEINLCYNFCLNGGDCSMNRNEKTLNLEPKCSCKRGFVGDHCESDVCSNFCLNNGKCSVGNNKKPICECKERFSGARCEKSKVETSAVLTESHADVRKEIEFTTSSEVSKVSESTEHQELNVHQSHTAESSDEEQLEFQRCPQNNVNIPYVILAVCVTISLLLFLAILVVIKKINRPLRPKIRKKYVVHKNIEPLTYRPTTEQCEVIIEDCCNMNICETVSQSNFISKHFNILFFIVAVL